MSRKVKFSIAGKLIVIITAILLFANAIVAYKASEDFKEMSGRREEDVNRGRADTLAREVNVTLKNISDKVRILGALLLKENAERDQKSSKSKKHKKNSLLHQTFKQDKSLISLSIFEKKKNKVVLVGKLVNESYLKGYNLDRDYLRLVNKKIKFPTAKVFSGKSLFRNRSMKDGAPLITISFPIAKDKLEKVSQIVVADVSLAVLQKSFSKQSARTTYLVDSKGRIVAHPDEKLAFSRKSFKKFGIVKRGMNSKIDIGQLRYYNRVKKEYFRSAFAKANFGMFVVTEAPESIILEPAKIVRLRVVYVTLMVAFGAILIIFLFSTSLTKPIKNLVLLTQDIAKGNFNVLASSVIKSRDEVGQLAFAFDSMVEGLKERDKVKNLFNKFQGSSVTEEMLKSGASLGAGKKLPVAVFFSDIRGFTAISEKLEPEGVVAMLNEYFTVMVKVIQNNGGHVDKYIGDAIMAIWGAPSSTGEDAKAVVKACLEMRIALEELNKNRIARGEAPLMIGMGVHYGEAIAGTIGSDERVEYTVIGDAVNMAARIEASTKAFGTDLLLSEDVFKEVSKYYILEEAGRAEVKGKSEPLVMFKVRGFIGEGGEEIIVKTSYSDYKAEGADKVKIV